MEPAEELNSLCEKEEEELERELEEVAASFAVSSSSSPSPSPLPFAVELAEIPPSPRLSFQFPGWEIDIRGDAKGKGAAVTRLVGIDAEGHRATVKKWFGAAQEPGNGTYIYRMPNEVWTHILRRLNVRDLCSVMATCRWMHKIASQDDVWLGFDCDPEVSEADGTLPRWIHVKSGTLSFQMKQRFSYFSKCYDYLRSALNAWWDAGGPGYHSSSKSFHSLIRKMTAYDWTMVYEALPVFFSERADRLAGLLLREYGSATACDVGVCFSKKDKSVLCQWSFMEDSPICRRKLLSSTRASSHHSLDGEPASTIEPQDGLVGMEIWRFVQTSWKHYKHWLILISTHCQDLNYEVMVERARSMAWSSTPTVYDKGVICFSVSSWTLMNSVGRPILKPIVVIEGAGNVHFCNHKYYMNQILLRYKIRNALQCGLSWLIGQDALGFASETDSQLLREILHLLQEVDVADDFTLSTNTYTRAKFKRCFLLNGASSKVLN